MEADETTLMYLYSVPLVALSGGGIHAALRCANSSSEMSTSMVRLTMSMSMMSPLWTCKGEKKGLHQWSRNASCSDCCCSSDSRRAHRPDWCTSLPSHSSQSTARRAANQPALTCQCMMGLARAAGVANDELLKALSRAHPAALHLLSLRFLCSSSICGPGQPLGDSASGIAPRG